MDVEPTPLDEGDILDEETMDELLRSPRERLNPSSSSTATAKELRALHAPTPTKRDHEEESQSPASKMKKNKATGKGVAMLEKINYLFDADKKDDNERVGFLQVRLAAPKKGRRRPASRLSQRTMKRI